MQNDPRDEHQRYLRRHWAQRLYQEYDQICFAYRLDLARPVIQVEPLRFKWGLWDPTTRMISLADALIESYPWEIVLEILKHEIAHQIVTDEFGSDEAHGPCFKTACARLGIADWARRAEADLSQPIPRLDSRRREESEERLLRRVEKLLALATSSNEHEALLAMQKVQELYAKYHLERLERDRKANLVYRVIRTKRKRMERHHLLICSILSEHFFVRVIHSSQYDPQDLCGYRAVELLGTEENVLMGEYVYHFLHEQTAGLWQRYRAEKLAGARSKTSYLLGILSGFREKLARNRNERMKQAKPGSEQARGWALVTTEDKELEQFVRSRYPRLVNMRSGRRFHDPASFEAGKREGGRLILHRAVQEGQGNLGKFLES